ncbi:hypothetical protein CcaCcLH18_05850 [Colletotrichum camelliae]|nr:hypothetical protein CcaCcLH18_07961 [Colletotrichum camelliae]KAH0433483.1 hypothetical protein CcaCcLH18_05850 [Colletotrichum camelliae]
MKALSVIAVALSVGIASAAPFARLEGRAIEVETVSHVENKTPATDGDPNGPFRRAVEEELENEARSLDEALEERDPKDNRNGAARAPIFRGDPGFLQ